MIPAVALLAEGAVDVIPLITHTIQLAESRSAFSLLADPTQHALKVLIEVPAG